MKKAKKEGGKGENDDEEERGDSIESEEDFCNGKLLNDKQKTELQLNTDV